MCDAVRRVLVVEDDPAVAELLRDSLSAAGYQVTVASDGLKALSAIDRERPDLVTVDLMLPRVSGFRVVELLKRGDLGQSVPVIVVSALAFEESEEAARAGADDFVGKPFEPDELVRRVKALLARTTQETTTRPAVQRRREEPRPLD